MYEIVHYRETLLFITEVLNWKLSRMTSESTRVFTCNANDDKTMVNVKN